MRVEIWSDLVCPWCYIGKRHFQQALAEFEGRDQVQVIHRSFQLDPTLERGKIYQQDEILREKYRLPLTQVHAMQGRVERTGAAAGLELRLSGGKTGNTFDAHRVLQLARARGLQEAMLERLLRAHFSEQRSLFDHSSLVDLAAEAGLDADETRAVLQDGGYADGVKADIAEAEGLGVTGVPFFAIYKKYGISGAQPRGVFSQILTRAT